MNRKADKQLRRIRRICNDLPETTERLSHGAPTFFAGGKKVFVMFVNNHHSDGHLAVWIPAPPGVQGILVGDSPEKFFRPPYVGPNGWIGVELEKIDDDELTFHIQTGWKMVAPKKLQASVAARDKE